MQDGFILMYVKDNTIYPVAMSKEQYEMLHILIPNMMPGTLSIVKDRPQGEAVNLKGGLVK